MQIIAQWVVIGVVIGSAARWGLGMTTAQSIIVAVALFGAWAVGINMGMNSGDAELDEATRQLDVLRRKLSWFEQPAIGSYTALNDEEQTAGAGRYTGDTTAT